MIDKIFMIKLSALIYSYQSSSFERSSKRHKSWKTEALFFSFFILALSFAKMFAYCTDVLSIFLVMCKILFGHMAQGIIEVCMMICLARVRNVRMIYKSMLTNDIQAYSDTYNKGML